MMDPAIKDALKAIVEALRQAMPDPASLPDYGFDPEKTKRDKKCNAEHTCRQIPRRWMLVMMGFVIVVMRRVLGVVRFVLVRLSSTPIQR